jgi:hypothetical protein
MKEANRQYRDLLRIFVHRAWGAEPGDHLPAARLQGPVLGALLPPGQARVRGAVTDSEFQSWVCPSKDQCGFEVLPLRVVCLDCGKKIHVLAFFI